MKLHLLTLSMISIIAHTSFGAESAFSNKAARYKDLKITLPSQQILLQRFEAIKTNKRKVPEDYKKSGLKEALDVVVTQKLIPQVAAKTMKYCELAAIVSTIIVDKDNPLGPYTKNNEIRECFDADLLLDVMLYDPQNIVQYSQSEEWNGMRLLLNNIFQNYYHRKRLKQLEQSTTEH